MYSIIDEQWTIDVTCLIMHTTKKHYSCGEMIQKYGFWHERWTWTMYIHIDDKVLV